MKIIDKRKDYYDYLTGIYGIDEKLVLDRRKYDLLPYSMSYLRFFIAGYIVEGIFVNDKFYYGDDLKQFIKKNTYRNKYCSKHWSRDYSKSFEIEYEDYSIQNEWIYLEPVKDIGKLNIELNCPILLEFNRKYLEYPLLKDFNLNKHIPAEKIYQWLSEWLGNRITAKEQSPELSNEGKIEAKGFDKKRSFRTKMK